MKGPTKPGMTIILEDAYKQNEVYRPWKDITSGKTLNETPSGEPAHRSVRADQSSLHNPA